VDQYTTLDPDSPEGHDYAYTEAAWDYIAIRGWAATPQLLFALKAYAKEVENNRKALKAYVYGLPNAKL
jgi:hypothetical protein